MEDAMLNTLDVEALVEFGAAVTARFGGASVPAQRHRESGYVFFAAPARAELATYYQGEYAESQADYYTVDSDYEPGKNGYHASRILDAYGMLMPQPPRTSFELGCAYGGMVACMAGRGIDAHGSDINQDAVRQGRLRKDNQRVFSASSLDAIATLGRPVDLIYSLHTLEHDPDMFEVIAACRDKLTEDGLLFISVPNAMFAGSVAGGFFNNVWANYPQHLHMLSAGFIPYLCEHAGFSPVFWDTRILFDVQPAMRDLFTERPMSQTSQGLWDAMLCQAGHGMELNFALTPTGSSAATRLADTISRVQGSLDRARAHEVSIRTRLRDGMRMAAGEAAGAA